jgi:DNA repair protein RecN (Recombination protein N)
VDSYAGEKLEAELEAFELEYREYLQFKKKVDAFDKDERTSMKEYDLAKYELNEIEEAELQVGEDEDLEQSYRKMQNSQNIMTGLQEANMLLDDSDGMLDRSARILRALKSVSEYDEEIEAIFKSMNDADSILSDASREISDYIGNSEFSGEEFHEVENRLNTINHLKDKYGKSIDEVLKYRDSLEETIEQIENKDRYFEEYKRKLEESEARMLDLADKVTKVRKKYAEELQEAISKALLDLNFQRADFQISIEKKEVCSIHGQDDIVFMISTNLGQPIKPLSSVASGGELSRIMLALKTVMAKNDAVDSIIFDEIDAGVSGKTAWKVSEKLGAVAVNQQVICITHLPQIAAMADVHYLIEKTNTNDSTVTEIRQLGEAESLHELARMLGGEHITEAAKENAKEMKILAKRAKIND